MLGFSGAKIEPVIAYRKTADDAYEQALRCVKLGTNVCPIVYKIDHNSYLMEQLFPPGDKNLLVIKQLLEINVWHRRIPVGNWKQHFLHWSEKNEANFMINNMQRLYPEAETPFGCETHGDPTWANVMKNELGEYRLIDPLPDRPEKPRLKEVDLGKILQSAIGWEDVLLKKKDFQLVSSEIEKVLEGETEDTCEKAIFWLSVHLWRLLPFAKKNNRPDIAEKAKKVVYELCV